MASLNHGLLDVPSRMPRLKGRLLFARDIVRTEIGLIFGVSTSAQPLPPRAAHACHDKIVRAHIARAARPSTCFILLCWGGVLRGGSGRRSFVSSVRACVC